MRFIPKKNLLTETDANPLEMNEIDLAIYVQRFPKFSELNILFVEADFNAESHCFKHIKGYTFLTKIGLLTIFKDRKL